MKIIETERLILRTWQTADIDGYFAINQDPKVLECLPGPMTKEAIEAFIACCNHSYLENGFCLFAVELKLNKQMIGFIGLSIPRFDAHFMPAVEIGWRLGSEYWGNGYATEGAKAVLEFGFKNIGLAEIVSSTVPANIRSIAVMERLGLSRDMSGDFLHPRLPSNHPLSSHILYRIGNHSL